jgi:hypothetical protein
VFTPQITLGSFEVQHSCFRALVTSSRAVTLPVCPFPFLHFPFALPRVPNVVKLLVHFSFVPGAQVPRATTQL